MKSQLTTALFLLSLCLGFTVSANSQDSKLLELRNQFALHYLQPDAHFALAKYYIERGNELQAFFILEYARRYRFEEKDFDVAFISFFGDPMPEPPNDAKDAFAAASKLVTEQKYDEAEPLYLKANKLYDKSFFMNAWIGRFYFKAKSDSSRALPFYFKSYFLYPHAYETEYVESRIRRIGLDDAMSSFKLQKTAGTSLPQLAQDENPLIVSLALEEMSRNWKTEYMRDMLHAMSNDDSSVRWNAFMILLKNSGPAFDQIVSDLMLEKDLRKRGLAAYAIVERKGKAKYDVLEKMLADPAELIRFDAMSALALRGGAKGKQILAKHRRVEQQPRLRYLIEMNLKPKK